MRVDVSYVFTPFLAVPCFLVFYPVEQGTPRAAQMFDHGQFGSSEQETVGHLHVPHEMESQDQDPAAPGTHRITGDDLLRSHQGDAAFTDSCQDPPCLRFLEDRDECQKLLRECPTKKDVGLGPTEVMYVMMPAEWSEPVDWEAEGCSERA